ncbi:MAG: hypothetical protein K0U98_19210 [Deltaproteobacteria bacterium]|nr:hypothetical protein [Deltaproteobacteria bacterium]
MSVERKIFAAVLILGALVVIGLWLQPHIEDELAPTLERALVAVQVEGSEVAELGTLKILSGSPFTLHAVVEARRRSGELIYYSDAPALRIAGTVVAAESLRSWDRRRPPKIRWFTVEPGKPFLRVSGLGEVDALSAQEVYRPEWPSTWSIPGRLDLAADANRDWIHGLDQDTFGTQRYQVRIEVFDDDEALLPSQRLKSAGAEVWTDQEALPTVTAALPGVLASVSEIFGLPQIEGIDTTEEFREQVDSWMSERLAFDRLGVLGETLRAAGVTSESIEWRTLDLSSQPSWGDQVQVGDLIQVLDRLVILYKDRGVEGVLDPDDLCFDFARGASVSPLGQVFGGTEEWSWMPLAPRG